MYSVFLQLPTSPNPNKTNALNMVEVDDPKTCLMFHMMTTLEPIDPVLESPLSDPMARQTAAACSLLTEIAATKVASEGMLLANLEKDGKYERRRFTHSSILQKINERGADVIIIPRPKPLASFITLNI